MSENSRDYSNYSLPDLKLQRIRLERERYLGSFWDFTTDLLGYRDVKEQPHGEVFRFILEPGNFKLILLPRGSFKSTILSISYPLWILANNPNARVLIDSRTVDRSKMFLSEIKQHLLSNERFRELFGDWRYLPGWREASISLPQLKPGEPEGTPGRRTHKLKEPSIMTGGIDAPVTGGHYEHISVDDLQDETNSVTEIQCAKAILHYKTLFPILEPTGSMYVVGTRWSQLDIYRHILDTERIEVR